MTTSLPQCRKCSTPVEIEDFVEGYCSRCYEQELQSRQRQKEERDEKALQEKILSMTDQELKSVLLTTETQSDLEIDERIDIVTAECAFGMNIFRDIFADVRNIVGGRSVATQKVLRDARNTVLSELRREALLIGANAVVGVDLDYSEFSGGGKSMLFLVASGTAVKVKN